MTNIRPDAAEESEFCHFVTTDTMTYLMFHMTSSDSYINDTEIISFIRDKYHLFCQDTVGSEESEERWRQNPDLMQIRRKELDETARQV